MGFPPDPQELRARKIGHVVVNSAADRPWSQYFCCMVAANREFVRKHPGRDEARPARHPQGGGHLCARARAGGANPRRARGTRSEYDYALQTLKRRAVGHGGASTIRRTRVRFYALRLHEAGMIKSSPQKIIAQGTDWRFLNELKKELKG